MILYYTAFISDANRSLTKQCLELLRDLKESWMIPQPNKKSNNTGERIKLNILRVSYKRKVSDIGKEVADTIKMSSIKQDDDKVKQSM